jgi:hypothetical protein
VAAFNEGQSDRNVLLTSWRFLLKSKGFGYYLDRWIDSGWKKKSHIIYPDGKADVADSFPVF